MSAELIRELRDALQDSLDDTILERQALLDAHGSPACGGDIPADDECAVEWLSKYDGLLAKQRAAIAAADARLAQPEMSRHPFVPNGWRWMTHPQRNNGEPFPVRVYVDGGAWFYQPFDFNACDFEWLKRSADWADHHIAAADAAMARAAPDQVLPFQRRMLPWLLACFGAEIANDKAERNHRFLEEALELVQACGCTESEAHQLVAYVFGRPTGERGQEVGGVMTTLAALCLAQGLDMHAEADTELARIWTKVEQIRAKQAAKPKHSPLPVETPAAQPVPAQAVVPEGWVLVPVEPTQKMEQFICNCDVRSGARRRADGDEDYPTWQSCYRAMLAAAPAAPTTDKEQP